MKKPLKDTSMGYLSYKQIPGRNASVNKLSFAPKGVVMRNIPFDRLYNEHIANTIHERVPEIEAKASTFSLGDRLTVVQIKNPYHSIEKIYKQKKK